MFENQMRDTLTTAVCLLGVLEYPGKDTSAVVCACVWIPTDSGVYPWGSGRDPVGCVIFTDLVRSRYPDLTDACFDLDDCKRLCCRRDMNGNTSLIIK